METPLWGPLGEDVFLRTYARRKPDGETETWTDTVARVVAGNVGLVPSEHTEPGEADRLIDLIESFGLLPGGRHLWVGGVQGRTFSFNCHHSGWGDRLRDHVGFLMNVLMTGGGSGSNYSNSAIYTLPTPTGEVEPRFVAHHHADAAVTIYAGNTGCLVVRTNPNGESVVVVGVNDCSGTRSGHPTQKISGSSHFFQPLRSTFRTTALPP